MISDWDKPFTLGDAYRKRVAKIEDGDSKSALYDVEGEDMWIPENCIHEDSEVSYDSDDAYGTMVVRLWWAKKQNLA